MRYLPRRVVVGFVLAGLFFIAIVSSTVTNAQSYQAALDTLNQHKQIGTFCDDLLTEVAEAESGQRGYVITGNSSYLEPYLSAIAAVNSTDSALKVAIGDDSNLSAEYSALQPLIGEKLTELNQTITLRETQGFAAAQALVNTNTGEVYMDEIRTTIGKMISYNDNVTAAEQSSVSHLASERLDGVYFNGALVAGLLLFSFYSLRQEYAKEEVLLRKEKQSRIQAQLLQDILTHDIRNYNQITKANAELLEERLPDAGSRRLVDAIQKSVDGSSDLIRKTRMLASITSMEGPVSLTGVDLRESLERSLSLVKETFPQKVVEMVYHGDELDGARVLADSLLDQVFVNVFSNAVKYTEGTTVIIEVEARATEDDVPASGDRSPGQRQRYWYVSITDHGKGIPDENKSNAFTRYLGSTKGRGLGLSIVRALVVERYSGKIRLKDRVEGDYTQGTMIEMWLPMESR